MNREQRMQVHNDDTARWMSEGGAATTGRCTNCGGDTHFDPEIELCQDCWEKKMRALPNALKDTPEPIFDGQTLHEFGEGWDKACVKMKALVEIEDAHHEALLLDAMWNLGYGVAYDNGWLAGKIYGIAQATLNEENGADDRMDREMLLEMLPPFDNKWMAHVQVEWLRVWARAYEMMEGI